MKTLQGVVRGRTIELSQEAGFPEGQAVEITVKAIDTSCPPAPGEGIRRSAGAWAEDTEELDKFLEWNREQRTSSRRELGA